MIITFDFRLLLGLTPEGRQKRVDFLEIEWSYEAAVIAKGYECFLEAGFQTMLQTYIQIRTGWPWLRMLSSALGFSLGKGYLLCPKRTDPLTGSIIYNVKCGTNGKHMHYTVCKFAIFARNGVGYYSQMIVLKMAISSNMQGAKKSCSLH